MIPNTIQACSWCSVHVDGGSCPEAQRHSGELRLWLPEGRMAAGLEMKTCLWASLALAQEGRS